MSCPGKRPTAASTLPIGAVANFVATDPSRECAARRQPY